MQKTNKKRRMTNEHEKSLNILTPHPPPPYTEQNKFVSDKTEDNM